ncbi:hypothetical protein [Streptomyces virginiae]|uniref:tetratricopeptide repeat protein n=1 Tax=Streptomyces virginiae TaxID=1961 RepID=UPI00365DD16A
MGSSTSASDNRDNGLKPRAVAVPRLPPGALREFKRYVYRLYLTAGTPSLEAISGVIAEDDGLPGSPSKDTVQRLLSGERLPGLRDAESVAAVLVRNRDSDWRKSASGDRNHIQERTAVREQEVAEAVARTRELWIAANENPAPPLRTVEEWGPFRLGVHYAVDGEGQGSETLTSYIERNHDEILRERLRQAVERKRPVLAVLVGQSSTGKTRAAYEAVRNELKDWPLVFPTGPEDLSDWITTDAIDPRTILWLNETQRYLSGTAGEKAARSLADLLDHVTPLVVIGSMWPEYARKLTSPPIGPEDPTFSVRSLLELYRAVIPVPDNLGGSHSRITKAAARDLRVAAALRAAGAQGRVIQQLTGGPELVRQYAMGPGNALTEVEHAVITAAVDARRLGHTSALPAELLADAAVGYLPTTSRVTHDSGWFETAIKALCPSNRTLPPLVSDRVAPGLGMADGYHPTDYLDQNVRRSRAHLAPPVQLWEAAERHARTVDDLYALGQAAQHRRRYGHAVRLYRQATQRGSDAARRALALLLEEIGDQEAAEAAAAGSAQAWVALAKVRERAGNKGAALRAYDIAARAEDVSALMALARLRDEARDHAGAEEAAGQATGAGSGQVWLSLARLRMRAQNCEASQDAYHRAVQAGEPWGWMGLARLEEMAGNRSAATAAYERAGAEGVTAAWSSLVTFYWEHCDYEGAKHAATRAANVGDAEAWSVLARLRAQAGDRQGADLAYTTAAATGAISALAPLARLREQSGDPAGAQRAAKQAAGSGNGEAWAVLALYREDNGDREGADHAARQAAKTGDTDAWTALARRREGAALRNDAKQRERPDHGRVVTELVVADHFALERAAAERAAEEAAENGDADAWAALARIRERAGDREGSERAVRRAVDLGSVGAWTALGRVREQQGDLEAAKRGYSTATELGDTDAWAPLARLYLQTGERRHAESAYRTAIDAGDTEGWDEMLRMLQVDSGRRRDTGRGPIALHANGEFVWFL